MHVFDLYSKKYRTSVYFDSTISTAQFCVEKNYDQHHHDALFVTGCHGTQVHKYDLNRLLNFKPNFLVPSMRNQANEDSLLWKYSGKSPKGITILYSTESKHSTPNRVAFCENRENSVLVFNATTGILLSTITLLNSPGVFEPWAITSNHWGDLIVYDIKQLCIQWFREVDMKWILFQSIGKNEIGNMRYPLALCFDNASDHLIIGDATTERIHVINNKGELIQSGACSKIKTFGMCLNEFTGELLFCEFTKAKVHVMR